MFHHPTPAAGTLSETCMKLKQHLIALSAAAAFGLSAVSAFAQVTVGVSWSNFQEERWKTDEAAALRAMRCCLSFIHVSDKVPAAGVGW